MRLPDAVICSYCHVGVNPPTGHTAAIGNPNVHQFRMSFSVDVIVASDIDTDDREDDPLCDDVELLEDDDSDDSKSSLSPTALEVPK